MNNEFEIVSFEGDTWREREISRGGSLVKVCLLPEDPFYTASLPYARALIAELETFLSSLKKFTDQQKGNFPLFIDEIENLTLDSINFVSKKEPGVAEVTFGEIPSGRVWGCAVRHGVFYNLGFDD